MPTISIIIPLYNKAAYITKTIQSVISQSCTNWEILVVDNGSTDDSSKKVQQFQDKRIQLLQSPKRGPGAARNYGLNYAQGEWIQFLDADDLLERDYLEQQLQTAKKYPDADIIVCSWQEFTDQQPTEKLFKQPAGMGKSIQTLRDSAIAFAPWVVHAALVKRTALSVDYYWNEELDSYLGEDIAFWFKLVNQFQVAYGTSQGALYRTQTDQCRSQRFNPEKWFEGIHAAIQANLNYLASQNQPYTANQAENLMRGYSNIYTLAKATKSAKIQSQSLEQASQWLNSYFQVTNQVKISMLIRRLLGLKLFLTFSSFYRR